MISTELATVLGARAFTLKAREPSNPVSGYSVLREGNTHKKNSVAQGLGLVCKEWQCDDSGLPAQHIPSHTTESLSPFALVVPCKLPNHLPI